MILLFWVAREFIRHFKLIHRLGETLIQFRSSRLVAASKQACCKNHSQAAQIRMFAGIAREVNSSPGKVWLNAVSDGSRKLQLQHDFVANLTARTELMFWQVNPKHGCWLRWCMIPTNLWISTRWSQSELTTSSFFSPECRLFPVRFQLFFSSLAWHTKVHIIQKYVERSVDGKEKHRHQHFYCRDATLIDQVCVSVGKQREENREAGQVKQVGRSQRTRFHDKSY